MHLRYIKAQGSAAQRGEIIGRQWQNSIPTIWNSLEKASRYEEKIGLKDWMSKAEAFVPAIERYASKTLEEMEGFAKGSGVAFEDILILACTYEKHFKHPGIEHCTGFAAMGEATESGELITGQTNDESIHHWAGGQLDCVVHHIETSGLETLVYTHPGIPAYMGMNSAGLCVLWMAIDNHERALGVPTNILIRELLRFESLKNAVDYLEKVPRSLPNNYLLSHPDEGIFNIECSPDLFHASFSNRYFFHANHILDPGMARNDVKNEDPGNSTFTRYRAMASLLEKHKGSITSETGRKILSDHSYYPKSICAHPRTDCFDSKTLASMIFQPAAGTMQISFGNGCETTFQAYSFTC